MSNLNTAMLSIEAEIKHAKNGLAFYVARIESLERTLGELNAIAGATNSAMPTTSVKNDKPLAPKTSTTTKSKQPKTVKEPRNTKFTGELPSTGGDYWPNLVSDKPQHAAEILQAAIDQLEFKPTEEQKQKMRQRMVFALNALVKAKKIQDSGSGRNRRFARNTSIS